jgi:hypothetical protein
MLSRICLAGLVLLSSTARAQTKYQPVIAPLQWEVVP